jgi:hypothetical protein
VKKVLDSYKSTAAEVKASYEKLEDLSGSDATQYQDYTKAAVGFIDTSTALYEESLALIEYAADTKAKVEAGGQVDMNVYNQKVADSSAKLTTLQQQMDAYQQQMDDLEKNFQ